MGISNYKPNSRLAQAGVVPNEAGRPVSPKQTKTCGKCGEVKTLDCFYKQKEGKYGVAGHCKICHNAMAVSWSKRNPDNIKEIIKRYKINHPDRIREVNRRTKALRRKNERKQWTPKDWDRLVARYSGCCAYCGENKELTLDHIVPVSRGGRHAAGNFLPACRSCNSSKSSKFLIEWRTM
jgi:hypothetical protein